MNNYKDFTKEQIEKCERIASLMAKHIRKELTQDEEEELGEWVGGSHKRIKLFKEISNPLKIKQALRLLNS